METQEKQVRVAPIAQAPSRKRWLVTAAAAALALIVGLGTWAAIGGSDGEDIAGARRTIEAYVAVYNAGDIEAVMALFTEESELVGHPYQFEPAPFKGLEAIEEVQQLDRDAAAEVDPYTISNVEVSGNTVTWDHVWISLDGGRSCIEGHTAVVEDGKILSWIWPGRPQGCPG